VLKYSVIIPVYNVENYLPRCLDSLLAQNYTDLEILLIDNGSKDQSGQICEDYAAKFSNISILDGSIVIRFLECLTYRLIGIDLRVSNWLLDN